MSRSCAVCKTRRAVHRHHLVKQQKIRARWRSLRYRAGGKPPYKLTRVLNDPRLQLDVCGFDGCHREETPMPIPDGFWGAIAEYGLAPDLPRWAVPLYTEHVEDLSSSHQKGAAAETTVEARGRPDPRPGRHARNQEDSVGRAAGAHMTGQCQDGPSQGPAHEQHPGAVHGGAGSIPRRAA